MSCRQWWAMVTLVGQPSAVERASVWLGLDGLAWSDGQELGSKQLTRSHTGHALAACEARDRKIRLAQRVLDEINERTE